MKAFPPRLRTKQNGKLQFWKNCISCISHCKLDSFPTLKDFSNEIGDDINEGDFLILYNEMHEHLESMHNSGNQISK